MHAIILVMGVVLAGGPSPASAPPQERRIVVDQRMGKRLELVRLAAAETTPPMEGTLELVEGEVHRRLADRIGAAVLTPDGSVLAIRDGALLRLDASGRATAVLAQGLAPELEIDPAGERVALVRPLPQGGSTVEVLELSSQATTTVVSGGGYNNAPAFTPDGRTLLFVSSRTGVSSLFRVGMDGAELKQLTNRGLKAAVGPSFVPPPERGAARRFETGRLTWTAEGERWFVDPVTERSGRLAAQGGAR
ncbi:MAG: hypothetical protein QM765_03380 [Myxococcales bacterium]